MRISHITAARSRNNTCSRKAVIIRDYECLSSCIFCVSYCEFIDICGLSGSITVFYIISYTARFWKKKYLPIGRNMLGFLCKKFTYSKVTFYENFK